MQYDHFFFHVGLHKTASTYLQKLVFPRWPDITYIRHRNIEYFLRLGDAERYLISCEGLSGATFATLEERCLGLSRLAQLFPGSHAIIGFRPHGGFMASLYSQYLRYGGSADFEGFFSLTGAQDQVIWRREDLCFRALIECLESSFGKPPFVFTMGELKADRDRLLTDLARFMGSSGPPALTGAQEAQNVSLGSWQGRLLRGINRRAGVAHSPDGRNRPYRRLTRWRLDPKTLCHQVLGRLPAGPLVSAETRKQIDDAYREDWAFVTDYIGASSHRRA